MCKLVHSGGVYMVGCCINLVQNLVRNFSNPCIFLVFPQTDLFKYTVKQLASEVSNLGLPIFSYWMENFCENRLQILKHKRPFSN